MNFRKNRELRGLLIYTEPKAKVKKVSEPKPTKPRDFTEGGKVKPNSNGFLTIPRQGSNTEGGIPDTIINQ